MTFGMSQNQFMASQLILVFRPEIDFWHVQKPICGITIYFGIFRPELDFWHAQKSICGLTINFGISSRN